MKTLLILALGLRLMFLTGCTTQGQQDDHVQTHDEILAETDNSELTAKIDELL